MYSSYTYANDFKKTWNYVLLFFPQVKTFDILEIKLIAPCLIFSKGERSLGKAFMPILVSSLILKNF